MVIERLGADEPPCSETALVRSVNYEESDWDAVRSHVIHDFNKERRIKLERETGDSRTKSFVVGQAGASGGSSRSNQEPRVTGVKRELEVKPEPGIKREHTTATPAVGGAGDDGFWARLLGIEETALVELRRKYSRVQLREVIS